MALQLAMQTDRIEGINEIREKLGNSGHVYGSLRDLLNDAARVGVASARLNAPKGRTGNLQQAIDDRAIAFRIRGDRDRAEARFGVQPVANPGRGSRLYPLYVHEGTGIYGRLHRAITPKRAPMMVFPGGGKPWPVMAGRTGLVHKQSVRGQRPQPFMTLAYAEARAHIDAHIDETINRLVE